MPHVPPERPLRLDRPSILIEEPPAPPPPPRTSSPRIGRQPDIRCPYDVAHDEGYLIRCLIRHYGWFWTEPGVLNRPDGSIADVRGQAA
jgi:hypothetical protein